MMNFIPRLFFIIMNDSNRYKKYPSPIKIKHYIHKEIENAK
jgi:hypothetical protein